MTLYTSMPLELVFDGFSKQPGPYVDLTIGQVRMQLEPISPGIGRIVRLLECPLDAYLRPELAPGTVVAYGGHSS
ncbi:YlzJ-like family protein [Paenibacillus sp. sptzw28]|uniref:YlzJ-like family protein n=1 Tax=Paenibacillus sp. sptzw28 TaxID=715179 RepID=UPI001C6E2358|nr:YlzJ-like family protein [Paenibacillus sp. sptzw28]QYR19717.1 YlzJ-like family protein [Paenibacillus sp. sptzw28]